MGLFDWLRRWRESAVKLRNLTAEVHERIDGLSAPIRAGSSDTQIAASIQSLNEVADTLKMQAMETRTVRRVKK